MAGVSRSRRGAPVGELREEAKRGPPHPGGCSRAQRLATADGRDLHLSRLRPRRPQRGLADRVAQRNRPGALELAEDSEHERKVAMRETAKRLLHRFNDEEVRPPPRGEAGFVEISRKEGKERWWSTGVAPVLPAVAHADQPLVTELVDLCRRGEGCGVALLSAERVRLLGCAEGTLEEIEEWELTILSRAWRERKAESLPTARASRHQLLRPRPVRRAPRAQPPPLSRRVRPPRWRATARGQIRGHPRLRSAPGRRRLLEGSRLDATAS